jgi:molybdopterin molybdotransferase
MDKETMLNPEEALNRVVQTASLLPPRAVALRDACGLTLAEAIVADGDCPPFRRAMMDGYAVRIADAGRTLPVVGEIPAGSVWDGELAAGQCIEILTGAPCPAGTEAVVQMERVRRRGNQATLPVSIEPEQNIAPPGSECRAGQRVLDPGEMVTPLAVAAMASFGIAAVQVVPRPTLGIITTGGELAAEGQPPRQGQIRNSNGPMLLAMAQLQGIQDPRQLHAADRPELILQALEGMARLDIVLLTGGVSVGTYDLVPEALIQYGAEPIFHGVKQKPGKPLLFARKNRQLIFGLPGNPLACHLGFHRYVAAAIRKVSGRAAVAPRFRGELVQAMRPKGGRTHFIPSRAEYAAGTPASWRVEALPGVSSADIFPGCRANCYMELPPGEQTLEAGSPCVFTWLDGPPWGA